MIQGMKKHGLKAALPLLLLATACGDGAPSASEFDAVTSEAYEEAIATVKADTSAYEGLKKLGKAADAADAKVEAEETLAEKVKYADALKKPETQKIPEPATLAGLAIAGLTLGGLKRKQSA